ncbi:hypothetical protein OG705_28850 [Streptomyces sp. NBC_00838]|uniref:hypothetical protein n=1 Tax=Streptomyces sp. NBC_00838 TaxID=2903680 RepID=UPI00386A40A1|nr:hypothetical protein OG705_28850 [Streptomyces sp. NBC_00838]
MVRFWLGHPSRLESYTRRLLLGYDEATSGPAEELRIYLRGRKLKPRPPDGHHQPYTGGEWQR